VLVKVLVREPGSSEAEALLRHPLMAPDLLIAECLNALRRMRRICLIWRTRFTSRCR
jgi:predicted nucleic acid-binding protein